MAWEFRSLRWLWVRPFSRPTLNHLLTRISSLCRQWTSLRHLRRPRLLPCDLQCLVIIRARFWLADRNWSRFSLLLWCVLYLEVIKSTVTDILIPVLSLRAFHQKRSQFRELLSQNKSLTVNRYFRLMALATIELICTIPFATYFIIINASGGQVFPYKGWADLHFHWSFVGQFPATLWRLDHKAEIALELTRWLVVVCAFVFFAFFGFADEARRNYKRVITSALESRFVRKLVPKLRSKYVLSCNLRYLDYCTNNNGIAGPMQQNSPRTALAAFFLYSSIAHLSI